LQVKLRAIAAKKSRRVPSRPARISHTFAPRSACTDLMAGLSARAPLGHALGRFHAVNVV